MNRASETLFSTIKEDLKENIFLKSKLIIVLFRISNYFATKNKLTLILGLPFYIAYTFIAEWLLGVEIPIKTRIGKGLTIYHGVGLVINGCSTIGDYCKLRQGVTIGNKLNQDGTPSESPTIGDHVEFGANATALGSIRIGDHAVIGAGSVVTKDVPDNAIAAGVPAKIIGTKQ